MTESLDIGKRIKSRRTELKLSLRNLAEKTDLTASFLSQLERGVTNSSLKSLQKIADALGIPLLYFLTDSVKRSPVVRANSRSRLDLDGNMVSYELLSPDRNGKLEALMRALKPGSEIIARSLSVDTEQLIFILSGSLLVVLKDKEYTLNAGDSIYFNGQDLVKLKCSGEEEARWVLVITPPVF